MFACEEFSHEPDDKVHFPAKSHPPEWVEAQAIDLCGAQAINL